MKQASVLIFMKITTKSVTHTPKRVFKTLLQPPKIRPISQFVAGIQHVHPNFSDNIAYPLTRTAEKLSAHFLHTGTPSADRLHYRYHVKLVLGRFDPQVADPLQTAR